MEILSRERRRPGRYAVGESDGFVDERRGTLLDMGLETGLNKVLNKSLVEAEHLTKVYEATDAYGRSTGRGCAPSMSLVHH